VADTPAATAISGARVIDSDEAVQRYKASIKDKSLDRFDLTLKMADGVATWQIFVVDTFGKSLGSAVVNASTGTVTIA
jgi:hypothetical protein